MFFQVRLVESRQDVSQIPCPDSPCAEHLRLGRGASSGATPPLQNNYRLCPSAARDRAGSASMVSLSPRPLVRPGTLPVFSRTSSNLVLTSSQGTYCVASVVGSRPEPNISFHPMSGFPLCLCLILVSDRRVRFCRMTSSRSHEYDFSSATASLD